MWIGSVFNSNHSDIVPANLGDRFTTELPLYNSENNQDWNELSTMNLALYFVKFAANLYAWIVSFYLLEIMWNKSAYNSNNSDIVYWSIWEIVLGTELPLYNSEYNQYWTELASTMNLTLYFVKFAANLYAWILSFYLLEIMWNKSVRNSNNSDIVYTPQYGRSFWERNFLYTTVNIINIELN